MKPPAFQFYAADFLVGTATMSAEEVGAYIRLLCYQWDTGSVPDDDATICRLGGCQASAVAKLRQKFRSCDGMLKNPRMEIEREKQRTFRDKQAANGAKRWAGNATAKPSHEPNVCSPSPSPSPSSVSDTIHTPPDGGGLPVKSMLQLRAEALFKRRMSTPLAVSEARAWKLGHATVADTAEEDWELIEWWYALPSAKAPYRKTDFAALLNNWHAEIEKARRNRDNPEVQHHKDRAAFA